MAVTDVRGSAKLESSLDQSVAHRRWIEKLDPRLVRVLTAVGFGFPTAVVFWIVTHYWVNVVVSDQWDDVTVIRNSYTNLFDWSSLWAQHNENRIFFPNLIVIALSRTVHFDVRIEELLGAVLLISATALLILTHKRRSPATPWLYYCPVAFLMLSLSQYGNMLWGFQMAWFLVLVAMAASFFLLDRLALTWVAFVGAIVAAVIGSFSSLQGLIIWPVGLIFLYHRRRVWTFVVPWVVIGVASTALYFYNFNTSEGAVGHDVALHHLGDSAKFYAVEIGDVLGIPFHFDQAANPLLILLGLAIILLGVGVIAAYGIRRNDQNPGVLGVALIAMGLIFAATVTEGRVDFGAFAASASRYTTFDLLVPVGIYLSLLDRPGRKVPATRKVDSASGGFLAWHRTSWSVSQRPATGRAALRVARIAIALLIIAQFAVSLPQGIWGSRSNYVYQAKGAEVLRNIDHSSNSDVVFWLYVFSNASFIRHQAKTLQRHHLNVFGTGLG